MKVLFLDESGDHNLNPRRINPIYPVFVLGGIIVDRAYLRQVIEPRVRAFKMKHFGREDVILHTVEMGKGRGVYSFLANPVIREGFYSELNTMLGDLDYKVIACVIRKPEYVAMFGENALDPYMYSLRILVEQFCEELGESVDNGFICAEMRNPGLDRELLEAWQELITSGIGTGNTASADIYARVVGFDLKDKTPNWAGSQLADLVITPIGRHVAQMPPRLAEVKWSVVESKLVRIKGKYIDVGLVIRP